MNFYKNWGIFLPSLWITLGFVTVTFCQDGTVTHLSEEDILLMKNEQDPKCFTRTERDFTCFFETEDNNKTYDLLYRNHGLRGEKRCEMSAQRIKKGSVLHMCSFPEGHVFVYVETHLEVEERSTNTSLYRRTVSVEDHFLLRPPFNVSLHRNGKPGQLQIFWDSNFPKYCTDKVMYEVQYVSESMGERTLDEADVGDTLDHLVPGEELQVQVRVKCAYDPDEGHWSSWSRPQRGIVPHNAVDISLMCFTSDLKYITCEWNGSRYDDQNKYKLFYQMGHRKGLSWTKWTECTECLADQDSVDQCCFYDHVSKKVRVKLISTSAPSTRTFYSDEFTLRDSIKPFPPAHLKASVEGEKLCLKWEAPLPLLSTDLQYEIGYQIRGSEEWMMRLLKSAESHTCLDAPAGRQYSVKLRAKPNGSVYSGHWSNWSEVLSGDGPTDRDLLLMMCIPVSVLITIILIILFYNYHRELKLYFWPPVPNLNKVLQGFLTEIDGQKWDLSVTAKQCPEETCSSLVEIMPADEFSGLKKPSGESSQLLSSGSDLSGSNLTDKCQSEETEVFPDYVTLNRDSIILCPKGNKYVYEQFRGKEELIQTCVSPCSDASDCFTSCMGTNYQNYSYLAQAGWVDR